MAVLASSTTLHPSGTTPRPRLQHNVIHLHRSATTLDQLQHDKALPILPEPPPSCTFSVPCWEAVAMVFSRTTEETCSSRMRAKDRLTLPSTATTPDRTTRQSPVADVSSNSGRLVTDDTRPWVWQKDAATWCVGRGRWWGSGDGGARARRVGGGRQRGAKGQCLHTHGIDAYQCMCVPLMIPHIMPQQCTVVLQ